MAHTMTIDVETLPDAAWVEGVYFLASQDVFKDGSTGKVRIHAIVNTVEGRILDDSFDYRMGYETERRKWKPISYLRWFTVRYNPAL